MTDDDNQEPLLRRIGDLERQIGQLTARIEEIAGYYGARVNHLVGSQSVYLGDHTALTFLESGHRIYVDTRSVDIGSHLLMYGRWEDNYAQAFKRLIKSGETVFDLGANHGFYTLLAAASTGPAGKVHSFEANPRFAQLANMSAQVNGFGGYVKVHQVAVGQKEGEAVLSFNHEFSGGGSLFGGRHQETVACRVVSLDEMFPAPEFLVDVIKMDIEGAEGQALFGMRKLLERSVNVRIMLEFAPEMLLGSGVTPAEAIGLLRELGFRAWEIDAESNLHQADLESLAKATNGLQNLVFSRADLG